MGMLVMYYVKHFKQRAAHIVFVNLPWALRLATKLFSGFLDEYQK